MVGVVCGCPSAGARRDPLPLTWLAYGTASLRLGVRGCQSPVAVGGMAERGAGWGKQTVAAPPQVAH